MKKTHVNTSDIHKKLLDNELDILRKCNHPRTMKIYDLLEDDLNYYVVSEFIQGGNLMKNLKANKKPYTEF